MYTYGHAHNGAAELDAAGACRSDRQELLDLTNWAGGFTTRASSATRASRQEAVRALIAACCAGFGGIVAFVALRLGSSSPERRADVAP